MEDIYKTERVCCCLPHFMLCVANFVAVEGTWCTVGTCFGFTLFTCAAEYGGIRV